MRRCLQAAALTLAAHAASDFRTQNLEPTFLRLHQTDFQISKNESVALFYAKTKIRSVLESFVQVIHGNFAIIPSFWHFLDLAIFFFKQKTAYEITTRLVGSEMCIRDRV